MLRSIGRLEMDSEQVDTFLELHENNLVAGPRRSKENIIAWDVYTAPQDVLVVFSTSVYAHVLLKEGVLMVAEYDDNVT